MKKKRYIPASAALHPRVAEIVRFVRFTNEFRRKVRLIWYKGVRRREQNGEHTFQLMFVAWFIQQRHLPHLDLLTVILEAMVHDTPETYAEDTPAFADKTGHFKVKHTRATKKEREAKAIARLTREWGGSFPDFIKRLNTYERQESEESRFVNALDKFLAEVNIFEDNGRTDKKLGLILQEKVAYKRPRIAAHPFMLELYDEFCRFCELRPELFFQPPATKTTEAAE